MKYGLLCFFFCIFVQEALAIDPNKSISQYISRKWDQEYGLPQNSVFAIIQSRDGYLWLSTQEGIARFDGVRFTVYNKSNLGLSTNFTNKLLEDKQGRIWIGSDSGLNCMVDGSLVENPAVKALEGLYIENLYLDDEILWIASVEGLFRFKDNQVTRFMKEDGLPNNYTFVMAHDQFGTFWVETWSGMAFFDGQRFQKIERDLKAYILCMFKDSKGRFWIGTNKGLFEFIDRKFVPHPNNDQLSFLVSTVFEDRHQNLWLGFQGGGVARVNDRTVDRFSTENGWDVETVYTITEDREGNIWLGSDSEGLLQFSDGSVTSMTTKEGLPSNVVTSCYVDDDDSLWFSTFGNGVAHYRDGKVIKVYTAEDGLSDDRVRGVLRAADGSLYIATQVGGLNVLRDGKIHALDEDDGIPVKRIGSMYRDHDGSIWFSTYKGLIHKSTQGIRIFTTEDGLNSNRIMNCFRDREGILWIATLSSGLNYMKDGQIYAVADDEICSKFIIGIHEDEKGNLWMATSGDGLLLRRTGKWFCLDYKSGILEETIHDITVDAYDNIWMTTNKGIYSAPSYELIDKTMGRSTTINLQHYGINNGMKSAECNVYALPSIGQTSDGRLWFPTVAGAASILPTEIQVNELAPPVYIENLIVDDKVLPFEEHLVFPPETNRIEIKYTALSFTSPEQVSFRYILDNHDSDWQVGSRDRRAYFTNLGHGEYAFSVTAANNNMVWNESAAKLSFTILPYWHQKTSFRILFVIVFFGIGIAVHRLRLMNIQRKEYRLEKQVAERVADLEDANNRLLAAQSGVVSAAHRSGMVEIATNVLSQLDQTLSTIEGTTETLVDRTGASLYDELQNMVNIFEIKVNTAGFFDTTEGQILKERLIETLHMIPSRTEHLSIGLQKIRNDLDQMAEVIKAQQDYAKVSGSENLLDINSIIGDAIRLKAHILHGTEVDVVQKLEQVPTVRLSKTKLLRVLVHLIRNACEAMVDCAQRHLILETRYDKTGGVTIIVADTGEGIAKEYLRNIFMQGFSTRENHQGFGLHSCANAITELGGSIYAESDGFNKGARFIINFPEEIVSKIDDSP